MKKIKFYKIVMLAILLITGNAFTQQLNRHVISSGGKLSAGQGIKINCTVGQTHIALLKSANQDIYNGVGYWYNASYIMNHPNPVSVVIIPELSAEIGENVTVPLILQETRYNQLITSRSFEAKIKYNTTVLQPVNYIPECNLLEGNECIITVNGQMNDSSGILSNMDFIVRLGSVENSPLIIESFKWVNHDDVIVLKQDGELEVLGICREGDTLRTVKKTIKAGLYASLPEPASDETLINYSLSETGYTKISLINSLGREIAVLNEGIAEPGRHSLLADLTDISSGLYYINLVTTTERFSRKLLIQK